MFTTLVKPPPYAFDFCVLTKPKMVPLLSKRAKPICIFLRYFVIAFSRKCLKIFSLFICFRLPQILFLHASLYTKLVFVKDFAVYDFLFKVSDFITAFVDIFRLSYTVKDTHSDVRYKAKEAN